MGYFGNRSSGGLNTYSNGIIYMRSVDPVTNAALTGSASAFTQIGFYKNLKIDKEKSKQTDFVDDTGLAVHTVMVDGKKGTITLDLMERDASAHVGFLSGGATYQIVVDAATITVGGVVKHETWLAPYAILDGGFSYAPGAEQPTYPLEFATVGAKAAVSVVLPSNLSGTTASVAANALYWRQDV